MIKHSGDWYIYRRAKRAVECTCTLLRTLFACLLILLVPVYAMAMAPPVGDEPGDYYRDREEPKYTQEPFPVKDEVTHLGLAKVVREKDRTVRAAAMRALGTIADPRDASIVLKGTDDPVPDVRCEALWAFSRVSPEKLESVAGQKLRKDPSPIVRRAAARLLGEAGKGGRHLVAALEDRESMVREAAVAALAKVGGSDARENLPGTFKDVSARVRAACALALVDAGVPGSDRILISGLSDKEEIVRGACATALGRLGGSAAAAAERVVKKGETRYVLQCALDALGAGRVKQALPSIHRMLTHSDMGVRTSACRACGSIKDVSSVEPVGKLLADRQYQVRHEAASALLEIGGEQAGDMFCKMIRHDLAIARREAAWGLGKMKFPKGLDLLCKAVRDEDEEVRIISAWSLGSMGDSGGGGALCAASSDKAEQVRAEVARSLGRVDTPEDRITLVKMLTDKDTIVRARAARSLGEFKHSAAVQPLIKVVTDYNPQAFMRMDAAWALGEIGAKEAIPAVRKLLLVKVIRLPMMPPTYDSDDARSQAVRSLAKIGHEGFVRDLEANKRLSDSEFMGGAFFRKAVAEVMTELTGNRYDWVRPRRMYTPWFIESRGVVKRSYSHGDPIVFPKNP